VTQYGERDGKKQPQVLNGQGAKLDICSPTWIFLKKESEFKGGKKEKLQGKVLKGRGAKLGICSPPWILGARGEDQNLRRGERKRKKKKEKKSGR
jgi:protein required for attachment to host cells